jgi:parallel beta-helix repeat protein
MTVPLDAGYVALVNCTQITVQGLNLTNNGQGILLASTVNCTINENNVTGNGNGIWLDFSSRYNRISGNDVAASDGYGIHLRSSSTYNTLSGNNVTGNVDGIALSQVDFNNVSGNELVANTRYGIEVANCWNSTVCGNSATTSGACGIYLRGTSRYCNVSGNNIALTNGNGIMIENTSNDTISGNNVTANNGNGIELMDSSFNIIKGNSITANNGNGLMLYRSRNNTVSENNVAYNAYGVTALGNFASPSSGNTIYHNLFTENGLQASTDTWSINVWDLGYPAGGNYWSNYSGLDLFSGPYQNEPGSDGIGDTAYMIDPANLDHYPLVAVHDIAATNITSPTTAAGQAYNVSLKVTVRNQGIYTETFDVTIYANTTIIRTNSITLASKGSTTVALAWNTSGFAYGNYTIWAYAGPVSGESETEDNNCTGGWIFVSIPGDIAEPYRLVDIFDVVAITGIYESELGDPGYKANSDIDGNGIIDIFDVVACTSHYEESW